MKKSEFTKLMIPGPVEVDPQVLAAMSRPVEPHYGPEWVNKLERVNNLLKQVFQTQNEIFLMAGSGSCAIDASIGSSLQTGEKIIIGNNGFFGDRLVSIAEHNGIEVAEVKQEWGKKLDTQKILNMLKAHPDAKAVAVVHSETSTTVLNPIDEIGLQLKDKNVLFIVDAVSSLGGVPVQVDDWGIDLCASASQKCLGGIPGLAPIAVSSKAWQLIDRTHENKHGWFTDLRVWRKYAQEWGSWHPTPITISSNVVNGLLVALEMLIDEGIEKRMERFRRLALSLRKGLHELELKPFTPDEELNPVLTAAYSPAGVDSGEIVTYLNEAHHIQISGGLGFLKPKIFRVGHMSPVINLKDIQNLLSALKDFQRQTT
ncbi:MAG: alanine--glyoxylate aminotransferase family protein [Pelolinea sp.]|nr:alanine--glyoxylate aminotransferase family protein [Pelolinea sp.]